MEGKIKEIHERYEPTNEKKAMDCGFSGQQCPNCKGMRVGYDRILNGKWKEGDPIHTKFDTVLTCFNCNHIPERRTYSLPKQTPLVKVNWDSNQ
jgi:excinuclease UvrABC ATPase subunit